MGVPLDYPDWIPRLDYYDRILGGVAALVALGVAVGFVAPIDPRHGLAAGSLAATVLVYHTVFRNPRSPVGASGTGPGSSSGTCTWRCCW